MQGRETDKETEKQNGKKKKEDESWSCSSAGEDNEEEDESSSREQAPEADEDARADEAAGAELVLNVTCLDQVRQKRANGQAKKNIPEPEKMKRNNAGRGQTGARTMTGECRNRNARNNRT